MFRVIPGSDKQYDYDLGLVKLVKPLPLTPKPMLINETNAICLPVANSTNVWEELVEFSGWGMINDTLGAQQYQIGWTRIFPIWNNESDGFGRWVGFVRYPPMTGSSPCTVSCQSKCAKT